MGSWGEAEELEAGGRCLVSWGGDGEARWEGIM